MADSTTKACLKELLKQYKEIVGHFTSTIGKIGKDVAEYKNHKDYKIVANGESI